MCTNIDSVTERSLRPEFRKLVREPLEIALERLQRHRDLKQGKCQIFIWNFTMCSICFLFMKAQWPVSYSRAVKYRPMQTHISLGLHGPPSYYHHHHVPCKMACVNKSVHTCQSLVALDQFCWQYSSILDLPISFFCLSQPHLPLMLSNTTLGYLLCYLDSEETFFSRMLSFYCYLNTEEILFRLLFFLIVI